MQIGRHINRDRPARSVRHPMFDPPPAPQKKLYREIERKRARIGLGRSGAVEARRNKAATTPLRRVQQATPKPTHPALQSPVPAQGTPSAPLDATSLSSSQQPSPEPRAESLLLTRNRSHKNPAHEHGRSPSVSSSKGTLIAGACDGGPAPAGTASPCARSDRLLALHASQESIHLPPLPSTAFFRNRFPVGAFPLAVLILQQRHARTGVKALLAP